MKHLLLVCICLLLTGIANAVQNAKIIGDAVDIYEAADFDADIIEEVHKGEVYKISNKVYGAFYRIKLKSGKVGYIVDYELDIEGKGPLREKDLDEMELKEALGVKAPLENEAQNEADEREVFGNSYSGPTLQVFNYHEDTMGSEQVDELLVLGYRSFRTLAWSVAGTIQTPKYYTKTAGVSAKSLQVWSDVGFSNEIGQFSNSSALRFSGNVFGHLSVIQVETPTDKYDLQDLTAGINLELGYIKKFKKFALDFSLKYYFDKSNYAALGMALLF